MSDIRTAYAKCPCCSRFALENGEYVQASFTFVPDPINSPDVVNRNIQVLELLMFDRQNPGHFPAITCSSCAYKQLSERQKSTFTYTKEGKLNRIHFPKQMQSKGA